MHSARRWFVLVAVLAVILVGIPAGVYASHQFVDVPDSNIFHADIGWLADAGVTKGCNPPDNDMYCPKDPVTREQMAAFMRRLAENKVVDAATAMVADDATMLGGQPPAFYTNPISGVYDDGLTTVSQGVDTELTTMQVVAPSDGNLFVAAYANSRNAASHALWVQLDDTTCSRVTRPSLVLFTAGDGDNPALSRSLPVTEGAHNLTLCYTYFTGAATMAIDRFSVSSVFSGAGL